MKYSRKKSVIKKIKHCIFSPYILHKYQHLVFPAPVGALPWDLCSTGAGSFDPASTGFLCFQEIGNPTKIHWDNRIETKHKKKQSYAQA